jgi:hypothetical protein
MSHQSDNTERLLAQQRQADAVDGRLRRAARDVSTYLTKGEVNTGTCLAIIEFAMGLAYWESKNPGKQVNRDEIFGPLLAGLAGVDDDVALEAACAFTANIGWGGNIDHYRPGPEDLLCYVQAAERAKRVVDKLAPPRKKVVLRRPEKIILKRPTK